MLFLFYFIDSNFKIQLQSLLPGKIKTSLNGTFKRDNSIKKLFFSEINSNDYFLQLFFKRVKQQNVK